MPGNQTTGDFPSPEKRIAPADGWYRWKSRGIDINEKILSLYARGMTVREIQSHLEEIYSAEVSPSLISSVTDAVSEEAKTWRSTFTIEFGERIAQL